ncbi:hypothetical protein J6590_086517 [Homalodisca vitripennis]|nr:hypothetical protein J6590_086517 [Homalodisca vitripennis]
MHLERKVKQRCFILSGEIRAKRPSLTLTTNGLKCQDERVIRVERVYKENSYELLCSVLSKCDVISCVFPVQRLPPGHTHCSPPVTMVSHIVIGILTSVIVVVCSAHTEFQCTTPESQRCLRPTMEPEVDEVLSTCSVLEQVKRRIYEFRKKCFRFPGKAASSILYMNNCTMCEDGLPLGNLFSQTYCSRTVQHSLETCERRSEPICSLRRMVAKSVDEILKEILRRVRYFLSVYLRCVWSAIKEGCDIPSITLHRNHVPLMPKSYEFYKNSPIMKLVLEGYCASIDSFDFDDLHDIVMSEVESEIDLMIPVEREMIISVFACVHDHLVVYIIA